MNEQEQAVAAARGKLEEAKFFLTHLRETEAKSHHKLEEAELHFGWYLSAFLAAARSPAYVINAAEGMIKFKKRKKDDRTWYDATLVAWLTDDRQFHEAVKDIRDLTVHRGIGSADSTTTFVGQSEAPFMSHHPLAGNVFIRRAPNISAPKIGIKQFLIEIDGQRLPAVACAERYLNLAIRLVSQYATDKRIS
jgi:hypothetical protein